MKKIFFVILLLVGVLFNAPSTSGTEDDIGLPNVGYAPFNLTANDFNCSGFLEAIQPLKELHIAFLYNTFGNDFSCLDVILQDPRLKTLEINLINEPGHRNNRLGKYEFLSTVGSVGAWNQKLKTHNKNLKQKFVTYVDPIKQFLSGRIQAHTSLLINPGLESNLSVQAGKVLISWTRESFPDARIVWNPHRVALTTRKYVGADIVEGHGLYPALKEPCVYNMDGTDVKYNNRPALGEDSGTKNYFHSGTPLFQQLEKYANRCEVAFVWTQEGNGLSYKRGFKDPRKRNNFIPTSMYKQIMKDIIRVQKRGKISPTQLSYTDLDNSIVKTCDVVSENFEDGLKSGRLLKQSEFPDRGGVLILPNQFSSVKSASLIKGKSVVDRYDNTGPYHDGRPLFRSEKSPTTYPLNTYLVFNKSATRYCFKLSNPRIRLD